MNILILTYGSRGDVQPYVALGKGLKQAGHQVTLGTSVRFQNFVEDHGLEYAYMNDDLLSIIDTDAEAFVFSVGFLRHHFCHECQVSLRILHSQKITNIFV